MTMIKYFIILIFSSLFAFSASASPCSDIFNNKNKKTNLSKTQKAILGSVLKSKGSQSVDKHKMADHVDSLIIQKFINSKSKLDFIFTKKSFEGKIKINRASKDILELLGLVLYREYSQKLQALDVETLANKTNDIAQKIHQQSKTETPFNTITDKQVKTFIKSLGFNNYDSFISYTFKRSHKLKADLKTFFIKAYSASVKTNAKNTLKNPPTLPELASQINSNNKHIKISANTLKRYAFNEGDAAYPSLVLFHEGEKQLKKLVKEDNPKLFENFIDTKAAFENAQEFSQALKTGQYRGVVVSSITSKIAIDESFFNSLLNYAKDKNLLVALIATNRDIEFLPQVLLKTEGTKKLYTNYIRVAKGKSEDSSFEAIDINDIENVFVLANTVHLSKYFTLSSIPIYPKNFNPLSSLQRLAIKNKTTIVGSPQLQLDTIATDNHNNFPTIVASTGSVNDATYPYKTHNSGRLSELAKTVHKNAGFVVEIPSKNSGLQKEDPAGLFIFHPIYEHKMQDGEQIRKGILDRFGNVYTPLGKLSEKRELEYIVLGDLHLGSTDPKVFEILDQVMRDHPNSKKLKVILHDFLDGFSINHHEEGRVVTDSEKLKKDMSLKSEYEKNVKSLNSLLARYPNLNIVIVVSNHPNWLEQKLQKPEAYTDNMNSEFMTEIRHGLDVLKASEANSDITAIEYLFKHRESFVRSTMGMVQAHLEKNEHFISSPERLRVLRPGERYYAGNSSHPIMLHAHGHNFKGKGIGPSVAHNLEEAVIGHTHSPKIKGDMVNVGTWTKLKLSYTKENAASDWAQGFALIYKNTNQAILHIVQPLLNNWRSQNKAEIEAMNQKEQKEEIKRKQDYFNSTEVERNDNDEAQAGQYVGDQLSNGSHNSSKK